MTVIIGMINTKMYLPPSSGWAVEPGVVVAADTRISYRSGPRDFGVKIDHVGGWAIVGYSGDSKFGNKIAAELDDFASSELDQNFDNLLSEAEAKLNFYGAKMDAEKAEVDFIIASFNRSSKIPRLASVSWNGNLKTLNYPSAIFLGSGSDGLQEYATKTSMEYKLKQSDLVRGGIVSSKNFSKFARYIVAHSIDEATNLESLSEDKQEVGGYVQACIADNSGITSPNPKFHDMLSEKGWAYLPGRSSPSKKKYLQIVDEARSNPY